MEPKLYKPKTLSDYFAAMSRAVFQSGMNWKVIDAKWDGMSAAFDGFDVEKVAAYTPIDVERLMADERIVRNGAKVNATIANAGEMIATDKEFGGFKKYLASFDDNDALVKDLHKRFKFLGDSVAHYFLYSVGFDVPAQEQWAHEHFGHAQR